MKTFLLVEIDHKKKMPDAATDIVADRIYSYLHAQGCECGVTVKLATVENISIRTVRELQPGWGVE